MNNILSHIKKVFLEILPAFFFFLVMFHILAVSKALVLRQYGIMLPASAAAVIGSLIVAKVVLIADRLPFLNLYPRKPLIYNIILKTFAFSAIAFIFLITEELVHLSLKCGNMAVAWTQMKGDVNWPAFWLREIWLFVVIFFYCQAVELIRALGADKVKEIFFGRSK